MQSLIRFCENEGHVNSDQAQRLSTAYDTVLSDTGTDGIAMLADSYSRLVNSRDLETGLCFRLATDIHSCRANSHWTSMARTQTRQV